MKNQTRLTYYDPLLKKYCADRNGKVAVKRLEDIIQKLGELEDKQEIDLVELIKKKGVTLVVKETECLNNEHITIQVYKKHTTNEEWDFLKTL